MNGRLHGKNIGYYPNGITHFKYQFRDGKKTGENLRYYPNSKIETREVVSGSGIEVKEQNYSTDGLLVSEKSFKNSKPEGKWTFYQSNGKDPSIIEFYLDGRLHGTRTTYHHNGKKALEQTYQFNLITGTVRQFREQGSLEWECEYRNSRMHGPFTSYFPSGKVQEQGSYTANRKHGEWKEFDENGEVVKTTLYKAGQPIEN